MLLTGHFVRLWYKMVVTKLRMYKMFWIELQNSISVSSKTKMNVVMWFVADATGLVEMVRGNRQKVNEIRNQRKHRPQVELVSVSC